MNINSKEYWNHRFDTDWLDYAGDRQTIFFADLLCQMLPEELVKEIRANEYSVCDMGCALGEGVPIYTRKFGVDVDGMDFSEEAIKKAAEMYPDKHFWVGNLQCLDDAQPYDVVICSNVLEHFNNPWKILKNITQVAQKYIIVMVPYKEQLKISEHEYHFSEDVIPMEVNGFRLMYVDTVDGKAFENSFYPDQQILMVLKKEQGKDSYFQMLNEVTDGICKSVERKAEEKAEEQEKEYQKKLDEKEIEIRNLKERFQQQIDEKESMVQNLKEQLKSMTKQYQTVSEQVQNLKKEHGQLQQVVITHKNTIQDREEQLKRYKQEAEASEGKLIEIHQGELSSLQNELVLEKQNQAALERELEEILRKAGMNEASITSARKLCYQINSKTSYKVLCACMRFVRQFLLGSLKEKKKFVGICKRSITRERSEFTGNDGYNVILNIANLLNAVPVSREAFVNVVPPVSQPVAAPVQPEAILEKTAVEAEIPMVLEKTAKECLKQKYDKPDILMFSVINYDFRFQRPQQFAKRFSENGHRVFYINANFVNKEKVEKLNENLHVVDFFSDECNAIYYVPEWKGFLPWFQKKMDDLLRTYAIRDAVVVLDYPNWVWGAEYLRTAYGFKIVTDYMDDFTGFLGTTTDDLKNNCIHMLKTSDAVVSSSQFLHDIAVKYSKNVSIVRNGTEVDHFYTAALKEEHKKRPVIGYYGAVSHWFDWEKVCYVADQMPDCDVVIIGEITEYREQLEKHKNIKLLGEKKYQELPKHLAYFDVCLIPFDTSTDLIKATNPVKFYEYLSAGKKVVTTEIPELEPYRDQYVYMSNENETFLEYIKMCLKGTDTLKSKEEGIVFAKENDWQHRYERFAEACMTAVPKVSIVVLTYNNLELNKYCISSILEKTAYANYELLILDNQSTDGTIEYLKQLDEQKNPHVKVIFNDKNSGFAGGNNKAIQEAAGEYIVLLNNDTVVTRGWLTNFVKHFQNDSECGMCGAVTNSIGNEAMIGVRYTNLQEMEEFAYSYTGLHNNETYTDVDRIAMFGTMIRKEIMDKYGMLDDNYQVGMFEDDDYAKVIEKAGYHFYMVEDVFIHHVNNASFKKLDSKEYQEIFKRNREYFEKKWNVKWKMPKYRDGVTADINEGMMKEPVESSRM